jgi:uncharacterized protein YdeI (YjbR/CyaY-like superfamily)
LGALKDAPLFEPADRGEWRAWLAANHATATGVWLVSRRRSTGHPGLDYEASIEEALCFGWVDGQVAPLDAERGRLYFAPRRRGSPWAKSNRARVERLIADGRMAPAGLAVVERAKADGSWSVLESVDRLEVPTDLAAALADRPRARDNWDRFPPSARHGLLGWVALAKRPETRARRIAAIAESAERGERAIG